MYLCVVYVCVTKFHTALKVQQLGYPTKIVSTSALRSHYGYTDESADAQNWENAGTRIHCFDSGAGCAKVIGLQGTGPLLC